MDQIKIGVLKVMRTFLKAAEILPLKKDRVLFSSYIGESYNCNPKYISDCLSTGKYGDYELAWAFKEPEKFKNVKGITVVKYKSMKWLWYTLTSGTIVVNNGAVWIPRRKDQLIIDTWHGGGCYKKVALGAENISQLSAYRVNVSAKETNLFLSSSKFFSDSVVRKRFGYSGKILECGMPRNDILFADSNSKLRMKIRQIIAEKYDFDKDAYIVLFAPTWRKNSQRTEMFSPDHVVSAVKERFGRDAVVLGRGHHTEDSIRESSLIDVTAYPDMQKLMLAADMLITDYSSCVWDYSFTKRPCLLFTPDLSEYEKDPGFEEDIKTWGFPVCCTNEILKEEIVNFDQDKYDKDIEYHHTHLGSFEKGKACQEVASYIKNYMSK